MRLDPEILDALSLLAARLPETLSPEGVRLLGRDLAGPLSGSDTSADRWPGLPPDLARAHDELSVACRIPRMKLPATLPPEVVDLGKVRASRTLAPTLGETLVAMSAMFAPKDR